MGGQAGSTIEAALTLEVDGDGVASLVFDNPEKSVNILSSELLLRLDALLGDVETAASRGHARALVVRSGKDGSFMAGANVAEIAGITDPEEGRRKAVQGQAVFQRLHELPIPTVVAIDGVCVGGGTEMALACDVRVASDRPETRIGFPELQLGILPGFGGTTRLPRLVGLMAAADLILTARNADARKAQKIGLVHERMHPGVLVDRARAIALAMADGHAAPARSRPGLGAKLAEATPAGRAFILGQARKRVLKQTGGRYPAPLEAIEVMRRSAGKSLEAGLALEAEALGRLIATPTSKNLVHVYYLMEGARKAGPGVAGRPVRRVAVLGAGVMGGGIAQLLSYGGLAVRLKDIQQAALSTGLRHARSMFDGLVKRRKLQRREADQRMNAIAPTLDYSGFGTADLVIEAVVESMDVKKSVLKEAEEVVREDTVLTSNTSSFSITELASVLARPENFAGMHFFNPVHKMPLVEIVRGAASSEETIATVFDLARALGKTPVIVQDGPGFLVNRLLTQYLTEATRLLLDGASIAQVDDALVGFGMPMGPLRLLDDIGFDVARHAGRIMYEGFGERMAQSLVLEALEGAGRLGRKNGKGFYVYQNDVQKHPDPTAYDELAHMVERVPDRISAADIVDRCVLPMVSEAARILEEGIARSPGDVDLAMITGTGFPPFRGGLLRWADFVGAGPIVEKLRSLERAHGVRFEPAPLLVEAAGSGRGFYT